MYRFFYLILLFSLLACSKDDQLSIIGTVPGSDYDGEFIYLVPFTGITSENIDSAIVQNGSFRFEKKVKQKDIAIIRTRPILRFSLQELLVVVESGQLNIVLDKKSKASGTALNETLQQWKEKKEQSEEAQKLLRQMMRVADDSSKVELQTRIDQLKEDYSTYNYEFVRENKDNLVGQFVYTMIEGGLTAQQKEILNISK